MPLRSRSATLLAALACALVPPLAACSSEDDAPAAAAPTAPPGDDLTGAGAADPAYVTGRKLDWLRWETRKFEPGNPANAIAHVTRKRLEPGYAPPSAIPSDVFDKAIERMDALEDGRDFTALALIVLSYGFAADLPPDLVQKIDAALGRFKFWYTDACPPKADGSYYWTENHQALYHTIEYLVGSRHAADRIGTDARLGSEHAADAKARLEAWLDHRLRFGFAEWHSNVYYQKDITPMLALVEHAPDVAIRARAAMVLDLLLFDLALHTQKDAFGVTHGRSYKKDKLMSTDEDTWSLTKMLFGQSVYDYDDHDDGAAVFAASTKYVYPEILRRVAADAGPMIDHEHMSLPIQEKIPESGDPVAAAGLAYDRDHLMTWWGMGALTTYPIVPLTLAEFDQYGLWDNASFADLASFRTLSSSPQFAQNLSASSNTMINFGLLSEVDTYTYRHGDVMLSSAQDWRKGSFSQQLHAWQATLDAKALVFTNHPFRPLAKTGDWLDDPENGGYWNGEATAPRAAQIENVGIVMYAPQWARTNDKPFDYFHWEPYTHAYFPQDYFDEVVQKGNWTFGKKGAGYVGLWSWRAPTYKVYDGTTEATGGRTKPFDLIADGGADNVWVVEVGREADVGSFQAFQDKLSAAALTVTPRGAAAANGVSPGFDVVYESPSQGSVSFGWEAPLLHRGAEVPLHGQRRFDNPWSTTPFDPAEIVIQRDGFGVRHDVKAGHRTVFGP